MPAFDFYFDFSSPYSYVANEWVDGVAARHGRIVRRHAVLLGATFQVAGLRPPVDYPLKREYVLRDFARSARFEGLPYTLPPVSPCRRRTPHGCTGGWPKRAATRLPRPGPRPGCAQCSPPACRCTSLRQRRLAQAAF